MPARILIVDDFAPNALLLETRLVREYYEVTSISDGSVVLAFASDWQPDVVILDVIMPGLNGYEICRLLKAGSSTSHIPIILVTGLQNVSDRRHGLSCGADEFLSKPVDYDLLVARLRGIIRFKRGWDEWRAREATATALGIALNGLNDVDTASARVLIVDNLPSRAARIRAVLAAEDMMVAQASEPEQAFRFVAIERFDLIILSLSLLTGDPLRVVARLRANSETQNTPLLLLTEPEQRDVLISGLELGANDGVLLPLDESELLLRATNHIRRKLYHDRLRGDIDDALHLAVVDPLTQLYNRRYFLGYFERLCDTQSGRTTFAVLMVDVDRFKAINDTFGHSAGDDVLRQVAAVLRRNLRQCDMIARYGGEEFIIAITDLADDGVALLIAEKLRAAVEAMCCENGLNVTVSIGVAIARPPADPTAIIDASDAALYEAKRNGRNMIASSRQSPSSAELSY